jgi:hypothetical protein
MEGNATKIARADLVVLGNASKACIKNVQHVASYNWLEASTATIAVPGCPPAWTPARSSRKLPKDSGWRFIGQNAARHPQFPLEPLFRAIQTEQPKFDFNDIDIISDRNSIRKLLYFVDEGSSQGNRPSFSIKAQLIGQTLVLSRNENKVKEFVRSKGTSSYSQEFEKAYTRQNIAQSTGHHRMISYEFQELKMMVRFTTDGYVPETTSDHDFDSLLGNIDLDPAATPEASTTKFDSRFPSGSSLIVQSAGHRVHSSSILEIKTRAEHNKFQWSENAAQQYLSQTPNLVVAYHRYGVFEVPKVESVTTKLRIYKKAVIRSSDFVMKSLTITEAQDAPDLIPQDLIDSWTAAAATSTTADGKEKTDVISEVRTPCARNSQESCPDHLQINFKSAGKPSVKVERADSPVRD